jgi:hypothetical protein
MFIASASSAPRISRTNDGVEPTTVPVYSGREQIAAFLRGYALADIKRWQLIPTSANGQPALLTLREGQNRRDHCICHPVDAPALRSARVDRTLRESSTRARALRSKERGCELKRRPPAVSACVAASAWGSPYRRWITQHPPWKTGASLSAGRRPTSNRRTRRKKAGRLPPRRLAGSRRGWTFFDSFGWGKTSSRLIDHAGAPSDAPQPVECRRRCEPMRSPIFGG